MATATPLLVDRYGNPMPVAKRSGPSWPEFIRGASGINSAQQMAKVSYSSHAWTYAAVRRVVTPSANLPRMLVDESGAQAPDNVGKEFFYLLQSPNPYMSGSDLWEATFTNLMLPTSRTPGGQCFWLLEGKYKGTPYNRRGKDLPAQIWPYSDNVIHARFDGSKHVGWEMNINGVVLDTYEIEDPRLIRIHLHNPDAPHLGLSPVYVARGPIKQDLQADAYTDAFLENHGAIGGLLTTDSDTITYDELKQYKQYFEEEYSGAASAGRVAALAYGLKYETFARSNKDMEFIEQRKDIRLRIQAACGVSEEEIGIYSSGMNRATADQADRAVWQKTRIPMIRAANDTINISWVRWLFAGKYKLACDYGQVEALREDYTDRLNNAKVMVADLHVPPAEACRILGIPVDIDAYPWLKQAFVPTNLVDAQLLADLGYITPLGPGAVEEPAKKQLLSLVKQLLVARKAAPVVVTEESHQAIVHATTDTAKRDEMWAMYVRAVLDPGEKSFKPKVEKHFYALRNEMLDNVDEWLAKQNARKSTPSTVRGLIVDPAVFLFDIVEANRDLVAVYTPEAGKQLTRERRKLIADYGSAIQWTVNADNITKAVEARRERIKSINTTRYNAARATIGDTVQQGISENWTPDVMAANIKEAIQSQTATTMGQARVVARTEMGSIASWGRQDAFKASDIRQHSWLSAKDERVRSPRNRTNPSWYDHAIDGQVRNVGAAFSNGLIHPLDPNGAAGNVINCRCVALAVIKR